MRQPGFHPWMGGVAVGLSALVMALALTRPAVAGIRISRAPAIIITVRAQVSA